MTQEAGEWLLSGAWAWIAILCAVGGKNVETETHDPSPKLQRSRLKKGKWPLVRYKTLKIALPGKRGLVPRNPGNGALPAVHVQRGHFKHFDAKPLFGQHKGTFWWQPHTRGRPDCGVVLKDYAATAEDV